MYCAGWHAASAAVAESVSGMGRSVHTRQIGRRTTGGKGDNATVLVVAIGARGDQRRTGMGVVRTVSAKTISRSKQSVSPTLYRVRYGILYAVGAVFFNNVVFFRKKGWKNSRRCVILG